MKAGTRMEERRWSRADGRFDIPERGRIIDITMTVQALGAFGYKKFNDEEVKS